MLRRRLMAAASVVAAASALAALPSAASADADPVGCTQDITFDGSIPTFEQVTGKDLSAGPTGTSGRNLTAVLYQYGDALVAATADNPRVRVISKTLGTTTLGTRDLKYYIVGTPAHIASLETDAAFWGGIRSGSVSEADGLAGVAEHPAFGWITATPHGAEPAAGEAISRELYELAARLDCDNQSKLANMTLFLDQARNPDGRDQGTGGTRFTAWGFDPNRDFGVRNYKENKLFIPEMNKYPAPFFIDAHQQSSGYFFPPNEDPVLHEVSDFSTSTIQGLIGPTLQKAFNDQSSQYRNYNTYDLFVPEYGDSVPSLIMGAAGMTYEKGSSESYGKQVYDHYLAIDKTVEAIANQKNGLMAKWVTQWQDAIDQGAACTLEPNQLESPLHDTIIQQPNINVCGYFYRPDKHSGDTAKLLTDLQQLGVHVYKLNQPVTNPGVHEFGKADKTATLPAGTLYIPMAQPQKHWIQAVLGENPFIPFDFYYDVVTWSYSLQRGLAGDGFLTKQIPAGTSMTEIGTPQFGTVQQADGKVYAFDTDSMQGTALVVDLLDKGVKVDRAATAFDAAGEHFDTGAALVDKSTLGGADIAALAAKRNTPIYGIADYPVSHYAMTTPKIAILTGLGALASPMTGEYCAVNTAVCEALFVLSDKIGLPKSMFVQVTAADLPNLKTMGATVLINANPTKVVNGRTSADQPDAAGQAAIQSFVNTGGKYIGYNADSTTTARGAGLSTLNTTAVSGLETPGSTFDGVFDTTNPVAWGFDQGGWIYREASSDPVFDPSTLGTAKAAVSYSTDAANYPTDLKGKYGYSKGPVSTLSGRPAVVTSTFGAGVSVLFGYNPYYRSWKEQDERLVLNAILYPLGAPTAAPAPAAKTAADEPLTKGELPAVTDPGATPVSGADDDVIVEVPKADVKALRTAVAKAELPKSWRSKIGYKTSAGTVTLLIRNVRTDDFHDREPWVTSLLSGLKSRDVLPTSIQG
jgi:hypothetical protein